MQAGNLITLRTDAAVQFLPALATNAAQREEIALPQAIAAGKHSRSRIRAVGIIAAQQLSYELNFFAKTGAPPATPNLDMFIGRVAFNQVEGLQIAGAGNFYFYQLNVGIPYEDLDNTGILHLTLVNRSVAGKNANAAGALTVMLQMEPTQG